MDRTEMVASSVQLPRCLLGLLLCLLYFKDKYSTNVLTFSEIFMGRPGISTQLCNGPCHDDEFQCPVDIPLFGPPEATLKHVMMRRTQTFTQPLLEFPGGDNFALCLIPKNMHTSVAHLLLQVNGIAASASDAMRVDTLYQYLAPTINDQQVRSSDMLRLAVVRDPVQRLVSFWISHCYLHTQQEFKRCFSCGRNLGCFMKWAYRHAYNLAYNRTSRKISNNDDHFLPQAWMCGLRNIILSNTSVKLLKMNATVSPVQSIVAALQDYLPDSENYRHIISNFENVPKNSVQNKSALFAVVYKWLSKPTIMDCIKKLYAPDYRLFGDLL